MRLDNIGDKLKTFGCQLNLYLSNQRGRSVFFEGLLEVNERTKQKNPRKFYVTIFKLLV
jgi:hypothetical protein